MGRAGRRRPPPEGGAFPWFCWWRVRGSGCVGDEGLAGGVQGPCAGQNTQFCARYRRRGMGRHEGAVSVRLRCGWTCVGALSPRGGCARGAGLLGNIVAPPHQRRTNWRRRGKRGGCVRAAWLKKVKYGNETIKTHGERYPSGYCSPICWHRADRGRCKESFEAGRLERSGSYKQSLPVKAKSAGGGIHIASLQWRRSVRGRNCRRGSAPLDLPYASANTSARAAMASSNRSGASPA